MSTQDEIEEKILALFKMKKMRFDYFYSFNEFYSDYLRNFGSAESLNSSLRKLHERGIIQPVFRIEPGIVLTQRGEQIVYTPKNISAVVDEIKTVIIEEFLKTGGFKSGVVLPPNWLEQTYMFDREKGPYVVEALKKLQKEGIVNFYKTQGNFLWVELTEQGAAYMRQLKS